VELLILNFYLSAIDIKKFGRKMEGFNVSIEMGKMFGGACFTT